MKKLLVLNGILIGSLSAMAQDASHLVVKHNKKTVFVSSGEDEYKNILQLKSDQLEKPGYFTINYTPINNDSGQIRTLMIVNELDGELLRKEGKSLRVSTMEMNKWLDKNKSVKIYTMAIPSDPELAARVRVRRVHLCTIER